MAAIAPISDLRNYGTVYGTENGSILYREGCSSLFFYLCGIL